MHEIDMKNYNVRSDLVLDFINKDTKLNGIKINDIDYDGIKVSDVILDDDNELNKKKGRYITITFDDVTDTDNKNKVENILVKYLKDMIENLGLKDKKSLIIGLGNIKSTPDSLGPKVIDEIIVTRYLYEMKEIDVDKRYSNVAAFTPGVLATTGIESSDIITGIKEKIKPDFLIVVDALASSSIDRINRTIQLTDTGISPGSGVGNKRKEISIDTIGVPVIAIGVPTVIDGVTIVSDTIKYMMKQFSYNKENINKKSNKFTSVIDRNYMDHNDNLSNEEKERLLGMVGSLNEDEIKKLIFEVLTPIGYNLMVTVKEVDFLIDKLSELISSGINKSLHDI